MQNMLVFMTLANEMSTFNHYIIDNYKTKEERLIFMKYNKIASKFIVITFPWMTLVLFFHYFKAVIPNILMGNSIIFITYYISQATLDFLLKQY
ncbi:odorant receptor 13a-like isoform X2 [Vespula squamosa]|uniref:Odorant receptor 13a-like isoform X2 n=1 Tax=Vespula squamosa TaxID=30214 RepID=A0ABD2BHG5_VESSQ